MARLRRGKVLRTAVKTKNIGLALRAFGINIGRGARRVHTRQISAARQFGLRADHR